MSDRTIAAVIPTRGRPSRLDSALASLSSHNEVSEIIVIDNGPDEATRLVAERYQQVRYIPMRRNLGTAARILAAKWTTYRYLAFTDDDCFWAPQAIRRAAYALDREPQVGLVAARVLVGDDQHLDPICEQMRASPLRSPDRLPGVRVLGFNACATVVRVEALRRLPGCVLHFGYGGEEELIAIELATAGFHCCYLDDVVAFHHPGQGSPSKRRRLAANALLTAWLRRRPKGAVIRSLEIIRLGRHDLAIVLGTVQALASLPWALAHRCSVSPQLERDLQMLDHSGEHGRR